MMKRMNRVGMPMLVGVVVFCAQAIAAGGTTVSISPLGVVRATESASADSDIVKVQGRGVGVNKTAALKDAYRDAIERAVGLYVDAETVVNNDQIVKDQILTQSNAYITDYRELSTERIDVGFEVRILATVKKQALTTKLTGVMPAQTVRIDNSGLQNVHAQLVTKEKRAEDAAALLKNALDGINPMQSLMVASIRPETQKIITADVANSRNRRYGRDVQLKSNQVMLRYLFEVKLDREKYFAEFMPHLRRVLEQISISPPKEIRLTEAVLGPNNDRNKRLKKSLACGGYEDEHGNGLGSDTSSGSYEMFSNRGGVPTYAWYDPHHVYSILWHGKYWVWQFGEGRYNYAPSVGGSFDGEIELKYKSFREIQGQCHAKNGGVYFALITSLNSTCSNGKATIYELDKSAMAVLDNWHDKVIGKDYSIKSTNYNIIFLDKDGEEISVNPWQIPNDCLINVKFANNNCRYEYPVPMPMVYATPFVGCFGENLIEWRDFVLEKDQLARVTSVKIEVAD